uniref:Transcription factor TFIIIC triple barrel domain-containing protein n=1 Tax=Anopheles farauti TaxID=69004 RepID=A0A182QI20_9DIPT
MSKMKSPPGTSRSVLEEIKMEIDQEINPHRLSSSTTTTNTDDDIYEEEITVFADFGLCLDVDDPNLYIKVIGIESENPVIQVNDAVYRGTADLAFGTNVFFEKDPERTATLDPVFEANIKDMYRYVGGTDKVLRMKRIFLTTPEQEQKEQRERKEQTEQKQASDSSDDEEDACEVNMTYEDALNLHLAEGCAPSRHITGSLNGEALLKKRPVKGEPPSQDD